MADINKVGAFPIRDGKVLVVRSKGENFYKSLGGRIEQGEDHLTCLTREVREEAKCGVRNAQFLATFEGPAQNQPGKTIRLECYTCDLDAEPRLNPDDTVEEFRWIGRDYPAHGIKLAHTMEHSVIPELIKRKLL